MKDVDSFEQQQQQLQAKNADPPHSTSIRYSRPGRQATRPQRYADTCSSSGQEDEEDEQPHSPESEELLKKHNEATQQSSQLDNRGEGTPLGNEGHRA
jgi:hypothetical protein